MISYSYRAIKKNDDKNGVIKGPMDALNESDLASKLSSQGLDLISCKKKKASKVFKKKVTRRDLISFYVHMELMMRSGVPIIDAIQDFSDGEEGEIKHLAGNLVDGISTGNTLSEAMKAEQFAPLAVELIKVGEVSGQLTEIFQELKESTRWQDELIAQTKKLMMYPIFMGTVVFATLCFMMIYLVPQMVAFIIGMGGELPLHTRALIATSNFFIDYWYLILALPVVIHVSVKTLIKKSASARYQYDKRLLRVPLIGSILTKIILSRFATNFALLYRSGLNILDALEISSGVVGNVYIESEIMAIHEGLGEGVSIADAFAESLLFPQLVLRMVRVGEQTGELDMALSNVTYFYNRDVKDSVDKIQSMIEPAMTVILGVILGWVMISVLGPIYDLIGNLRA